MNKCPSPVFLRKVRADIYVLLQMRTVTSAGLRTRTAATGRLPDAVMFRQWQIRNDGKRRKPQPGSKLGLRVPPATAKSGRKRPPPRGSMLTELVDRFQKVSRQRLAIGVALAAGLLAAAGLLYPGKPLIDNSEMSSQSRRG